MQRKVNDAEFGHLSRDDLKYMARMADQLIDSSDRALALQAHLLAADNK